VDVRVSTFSGTSSVVSADQYTYTAASAPTITSLSSSTGGSGGGSTVTITGTNFLGATGVHFGDTPAPSFTVVSATSIVAVTPPMAAGTIDVTVTANGLTSAPGSGDRFTVTAASAPSVSSLSTSSGSTAGGTTVTITGSNFTGANSVTFGACPRRAYRQLVHVDHGRLTAAAGGDRTIVVATPSGTSAVSSSDQFTCSNASAPSVTGLSLTGGSTAGGTVVTVSAATSPGATAVKFGTVPAWFTVHSDGTLFATAPPQAAATVHVTVVTPSGTSSTSAADQFTYTAASTPAVSGVTPSMGSVLGGGTVTILGSNFTATTAVNFGSTPAASFTVLSDTALTASVPAGSTGTVHITVVTPSGTSSTVSADQYTYTAAPSAPTVTALSTSLGGTTGGTVVVITGTGFFGTPEVDFGTVPATAVLLNSSTQLTVVAPPQAAATVHITATTRWRPASEAMRAGSLPKWPGLTAGPRQHRGPGCPAAAAAPGDGVAHPHPPQPGRRRPRLVPRPDAVAG
jgi:hypothetical protein